LPSGGIDENILLFRDWQEDSMAQVVNGRYTARMDEPFVVFMIGMWLPLHKDPSALGDGLTVPTV
jgi:hypothetical protein